MPTGACGINCDTCRLRLLGTCSSCGSGRSPEADKKLEAQRRIFGGTCTILECASLNRIEYCPRDCGAFPCENFSAGPYPFGSAFLSMQRRRLRELPPALDWNNRPIQVPESFWETLRGRDPLRVSNFVLADVDAEGGLSFPFLKATVRVDPKARLLQQRTEGRWEPVSDPMQTLVILLYFNRIDVLFDRSIEPLLSAFGIWALVWRVNIELLRGASHPLGGGGAGKPGS